MVFEPPPEDRNTSSISLTTLTSQHGPPQQNSGNSTRSKRLGSSTSKDYENEASDVGSANHNIDHVEPPANSSKGDVTEPYHIFTRRQKQYLVLLVSIAGCFSPLSSNIYFPAIDTISSDLHVSTSLVALTITVYMVVQAISPSIWGPISDTSGRRITFITTLSIYTAANLALAFTTNFPMLLVLRGVQAMGSAATISISAGVIADMATPSERGGFMGTNAGIRYV